MNRINMSWISLGIAAFFVLAVATCFYVPALHVLNGAWPIPLDDAYIHFDFARSTAQGHPFEWIVGNGYSSGSTSLTYPFVLAVGYRLGFRESGFGLGLFSAAVACAALVSLIHSLQRTTRLRWAAFLLGPLLVHIPWLDWHWFSGMELALWACILGHVLVQSQATFQSSPQHRAAQQFKLGLWLTILVATRPESIGFVFALSALAVRRAQSLSFWHSLLRTFGPWIGFLALYSLANWMLTGEIQAAGSIRKVLWNQPFLSEAQIGREWFKNTIAISYHLIVNQLGLTWCGVTVVLSIIALFSKRHRETAIALCFGALVALVLISFNNLARYQNWRYASLPTVFGLILIAFGLDSFAKQKKSLAALFVLGVWVLPSNQFPKQINHFIVSSKNIVEQQIQIGKKMLQLQPKPKRILVNDAGAIPFVSQIPAIDVMGLGGYGGWPWARASSYGTASVIELLQRVPENSRPDVMAVYPSWAKDLVDIAGERIDSVKIDDNVICGESEKVIYRLHWEALEESVSTKEEIDIGDLVSEKDHDYFFDAPYSGWVIGQVQADSEGRRVFDGGRITSEKKSESFRINQDHLHKPMIAFRTSDAVDAELMIFIERDGRVVEEQSISVQNQKKNAWNNVIVNISALYRHDRVRVNVMRGVWKDYHVWIE